MKPLFPRVWTLGLLAGLGCTPSAPPAQQPTPEPAIPTPSTGTKPTVFDVSQPIDTIEPTTPKPVEPLVKLPDDLGGKAVQKQVMPTIAMPAELPGPKAARARVTDLDKGELPAPPVAWQKPSVALMPKVKPAKPSNPPEPVPSDLGQAAAENLSGVKFVEKPLVRAEAPVNPGAADAPMLARQLTERAPVDDPTAEISATKLIETLFPYPVGPLPFLKMTIPDPYEFAENLKGKLPRETEFGTTPSVVPPEKK